MSSEQIGIHNQGNWSAGKNGYCVVSDSPGGNVHGGDDVNYYGGYLICESIGRSNVPIVAAAPKMLKALIAIRRAIISYAWFTGEKKAIDEAIAEATTPIAPAEFPTVVSKPAVEDTDPFAEPAIKYEDIDQHDVFIEGDQYLQYHCIEAQWFDVCSEIGKTKSQSALHGFPCRRPVKPSPVEPVAPALSVIDVGEGYRKVCDDEAVCAGDEYAHVGGDGTFRSWYVIRIDHGVPKSKSVWHPYLVRRHEFVMPVEPACDTENARPPLGIVPRTLWLEARRDNLYSAISRYRDAYLVVSTEWLFELAHLERELQSIEACGFDGSVE